MKLYIQFFEDDGKYYFDMKGYEERNLNSLKSEFALGKVPNEIQIINDVPRFDFKEELILGSKKSADASMKILFDDCLDPKSSIARYFNTNDDDEQRAQLYLKLFEKLLLLELKNNVAPGTYMNDKSSFCIYYGDPSLDWHKIIEGCHAPHFKIDIPDETVTKYVSECEHGFRGREIMKLDKEDMLQYIIPDYYHDRGWFDRQYLMEDKEKVDYLKQYWMDTLFSVPD